MNDRTRLMDVLEGRGCARKPWFADLSYLYSSLEKKGELGKEHAGEEGYLRFHIDLGAGICFYPPFPWKVRYGGGVVYEEAEEGDTRTMSYKTRMGDISSVQKYLPQSFSWAYEQHFVKDIESLRVMLHVFEQSEYEENYQEYSRIARMWGDHGIATAIPPISVSPFQKLLARWAGIEKTVELYMDNTGEFDEIMERIERTEDSAFDIISRSPSVYVEFAENLSSDITGRNFFERYNKPCYQRRIGQLHDAGKYAGIHIDGLLGACLPLLEDCGFDVAEAVTPAPLGDVAVEDLRKVAGKGIVVWGGIPGALFSGLYSEEVFEAHVEKVLSTFRDDPRFVLGVADQVPPDGMVSRVKKVREMVERG